MKTSTNTLSVTKIVSYEKAVELIAKAGFDGWDFSLFDIARYDYANGVVIDAPHALNGVSYASFCRKLKQIGEDNGIKCNQSHAPFPVCIKKIRDTVKRAIECTAEAGGDICVIHPDNDKSAEENAEFYWSLLPFAKDHGVRIATENMYNWNGRHSIPAACSSPQDFCMHVDLVNDKNMVACLDIGHAEMYGVNTSAPEMIKALGKRLQALHIHDNDKVNDYHQIPYSMSIDYTPIIKALKEINYSGYFTLEADRYLSVFDKSNVEKGIKDLYNSVKRMADEFESL